MKDKPTLVIEDDGTKHIESLPDYTELLTTPMNSLNRDQYKEVDERFDKEFTCIVTYEKWPDEEEQRLREPQYKFKDFPNTNPKMIKSFLHSELEKVRQETIDEDNKRFLEYVGKDEDESKYAEADAYYPSGRNQLRAELRDKVNKK